METVRIEAIVQRNGRLIIDDLPFDEGEVVEVVVSDAKGLASVTDVNPLKGSVLKYDDPFGPAVSQEDWEVLK